LSLEKSLKNQENSSHFIQYANELWKSIVFLTKTICNKARETLFNRYDLPYETAHRILIDAVSAIYLLENLSLETILKEYFSTRTSFICSILNNIVDNTTERSTIADRIIKCLKAFVISVNSLFYVFSADTSNSSEKFTDLIKDQSFISESFKDDGFVGHKIPLYLKNLTFKTDQQIERFPPHKLQVEAKQWVDECIEAMKKDIFNTFKYAKNLKSLVVIRDSIFEYQSSLKNDSWSMICESLFGSSIDIWSDFIASFYYQQSKLIIDNSFNQTLDNLLENLSESFTDNKTLEIDINTYLWSLDNSQLNDITSSLNGLDNNNKIPFGSRRTKTNSSITPSIQRLCKILDDDLSHLLIDIDSITAKSNDSNIFNDYLKMSLDMFCNKLCDHLNETIKKQTVNIDNTEPSIVISKILLICRFIFSMPGQCSSLRGCFMNIHNFEQQKDHQNQANHKKSLIIFNESKVLNNEKNWLDLMTNLKQICKNGFNIWLDHLSSQMKRSDNSNSLLLINKFIAWDDIEIEDELKDDEPVEDELISKSASPLVKSKISVPLVCSPIIQNILYNICHELTKNLFYSMIDANLIIKDLVVVLFSQIIDKYENILKQQNNDQIKLTQNQSLQMIFDLKFLNQLFDLKTLTPTTTTTTPVDDTLQLNRKVVEKFKDVCGQLESIIDPFDYDITVPFMQSNITKCLIRTNVSLTIKNEL
jgi:hypothetical protein